jgi:class 3 adenylate cyclase
LVVKTCTNCGEPNTDRARFCQSCGRPLAEEAPLREVRKTVTILFADVTGSTALGERLDAESLRKVMSRFFEEMASILERHGGSVEKFIGDAVMAVFGMPIVHEDDALRAVRAAAEMRSAMRVLNEEFRAAYDVTLQIRTGINTGEVVAGDLVGGQSFVAGDAVNVAARLEQAAPPGEVLIGEATYRLVRDGAVAEPTDVGRLRGKEEEVPTYRLIEVRGDARIPRALRSPMVGRAGELTLLRQAFELSKNEGACYLFTILGSAGVGKSRLTEEALDELGDRATHLSGRCLPYGEGITYWPIRETVLQACGIPADSDTEHVRAAITARLEGDEHEGRILEGVAQLLGLGGAVGTPEETFWGFRRFLEILSRTHPLVVVFEDIHWAEPGFLDLIEYLADFTRAPVLLVCNARPDLLEVRPAWGAGRQSSMTITLSSLTDDEGDVLVDNLLGGPETDETVRRHVVHASEGNPLFVEEIVRMLLDQEALRLEEGRWVRRSDLDALEVPPTISALLSARLERLDEEERAVAQRASVVGKVFYWGAVAELTPKDERERVGRHLQSLIRKDLLTPELSQFTGEDAFRFRHILIRDAAYQAIPKEIRAELHEHLASWVEGRVGGGETQFEEIIGHHLEQAHRYRQELGLPEERSAALAIEGGQRLASAGQRALSRRDVPAAVNLLRRAAVLLPEAHAARGGLMNDLAQALIDHGDLRGAAEVLDNTAKEAAGDSALVTQAAVSRMWLQLHTEPEGKTEAIRQEVERIIPVLAQLKDERSLARAYFLLVEIDWMGCRYGDAARTLERVAAHAARTKDRRQETDALARLAAGLVYGPVHADEALRRCVEIRERARGDQRLDAGVLLAEAELLAMLGRFDGVREMIDDAEAILQDLGLTLLALTAEEVRGAVEMLAGDPAAAERALQRTYEGLERMGERGFLSTTGAELSQTLYALGRYDEADRYASTSDEAGASDDIATQVPVRGVQAKVAARRGRMAEAEDMARAAVELARSTDALGLRADAFMDLAEVLGLAGRTDEALTALDEAARLFEAKGNVASLERARAARAEIAAPAR